MEIITYPELESKNELFALMEQALWWPLNPTEFEKVIKVDPRLQDSPIGFAATENHRLIGFVGVMNLATRTLDGSKEKAGGIWGVATHPAYTRKGIATVLMQKAHQQFQEKRFRFSFLNTGRTNIAYRFYQKLGYREILVYPSAYKLVKKPKKPAGKAEKKTKPDWNRILEIHQQATKNRTGLVIRNLQYMKTFGISKTIQPQKTIQTEKGYVLLKEDEGNLRVKEINVLTREETSELLKRIEEKATKTIIDRAVLNSQTLNVYQSRGYVVLKESYEVLMTKPLTKTATFQEVYGDKFYLSSADSF
ncbi:MAG: GNAT family N-acetyltransferase [Thermoproteota archaeon]|nr:GNAT family N-acetyltransferase [Thermoproteota archaeon]